MANSERIGVVARPTYPWCTHLQWIIVGERGEKTADSTSVADHQDWNSGSKKLARATSTAIGDRAKLYFIFETGNDIGTKQTVF